MVSDTSTTRQSRCRDFFKVHQCLFLGAFFWGPFSGGHAHVQHATPIPIENPKIKTIEQQKLWLFDLLSDLLNFDQF